MYFVDMSLSNLLTMRNRSLLNSTNLKKKKIPPYFKDFQLATQSLWKPLLQAYIVKPSINCSFTFSFKPVNEGQLLI